MATADGATANGVFFSRPGVAVLRWEPTCRAICIEWQGWADPTEFAAALEAGLGAFIEHRASRWLGDCRDMKAIQKSDQEWLDQSWFPRMIAAGLRRLAVVRPKSGLALSNFEDVMSKVPSAQVDVAYFATVAEAERWLGAPSTKTPPAPLEAQEIS